jgi:ribosomal protein S12 methylthiotransferase accessory factor
MSKVTYKPQNIERVKKPEDALCAAKEELRNLGLVGTVQIYGQYPYTSSCTLYDENGLYVTEGLGKGIGIQSYASAIFEALEHYFSERNTYDTVTSENIKFVRIDKMMGFDLLTCERPIQLLLKHYPASILPCRKFMGLTNEKSIYYPFFLTSPSYANDISGDCFNYAYVNKYATNNGTAIGVGFEEAVAHALSERIERDAQSLFLLKTHVAKHGAPISLIAPESLPKNLNDLYSLVKAQVGDEIFIVDTTSEFGVATFLASTINLQMTIQPQGWGCSLSRDYALERALLEMLQMFHISKNFPKEVELDHAMFMNTFAKHPKYQACVKNDLRTAIKNNGYIFQSFENIPDTVINGDLKAYLKLLKEKVEQRGFSIFYSVYSSGTNGITCLNVLVPGLEHFHLVTSGSPVLPSNRGMKVLM